MLKINYEFLINLKEIKLISIRHISTFQIRVTVHQLQKNKKKFIQATPYLILTPQIEEKTLQSNQYISLQSFDRMENRKSTQKIMKNVSQIDNQTNSFMTKNLVIRNLDTYNNLNQIVVFKGSFQVPIQEFIKQQNGITSDGLLNKLYVSCQLFQISNYSCQLLDNWMGFSLVDQGNVYLPINFFEINTTLNAEFIFFWSSIQILNQDNQFKLEMNKIIKLDQKLEMISKNQLQKIIPFSKQSNKQLLSMAYKKNKNNNLSELIKNFNERSYQLGKNYQKTISENSKSNKNLSNSYQKKRKQFIKYLNQYHWKTYVNVIEQNDQKQKQQHNEICNSLIKLKQVNNLDQNLMFYPFDQHMRSINITQKDFKKISATNSLFDNKINERKDNKMHLIVFVHGYQASSFDMQTLAAYFKYKNPEKTSIFVSSSNEGKTEQKIQQLAHRLAVELKNYINNKLEQQDFQISFICHSMGGLIARAALKYLQLYKNQFKTFLSFSSPHLGYLYHHSALVKTSLWILNQVKKDASMLELTMQDNPDLQKTFLYELSKRKQLEWFKYPIFIGSKQDQYVPFWSALVQDKDFFFETKQAKIYKNIYKNMAENIQDKAIRLQIVFKDKITDLSSFVGRTAHIKILNCIQIMQMLYLLLQKAF